LSIKQQMEQEKDRKIQSLFGQIMAGVVFFAFGALVLGGLGFALGWALYGSSGMTGFLEGDTPTPEGVNAMRILQAGYALGGFLIAALAANIFIGYSNRKLFHIDFPVSQWLLSFIIPLAALPGIMFLGWLNENIPFPNGLSHLREMLLANDEQGIEMMMRLLAQNSTVDFIVNLLLIAVLPAVAEELFFRGYLQRVLQNKMSVHAAVWITALVFSLFHLQYSGFLPRLFLGAVLGYIFVWSKSLWPSIILHFTNNAAAVFAVFFYGPEMMNQDPEELAGGNTFFVSSAISVVLSALLIFAFYQIGKPHSNLKKRES